MNKDSTPASTPRPDSDVRTVLITGGTGMIGTRLTDLLLQQGRTVRHLSRSPGRGDHPGAETFGWDVAGGSMDQKAVEGADAIIHLAGAGIADGRWTDKRRQILINSRVKSANLLYRAAHAHGDSLRCFVSANGINYYGAKTTDRIFEETDPPAEEFIGEVCRLWEQAAEQFRSMCRVVTLRTAMVLAPEGGAFPKLAKPIKLGVGAVLGSGKQYVPYIHIDDLTRMYAFALDHPEMQGPYNATTGQHITHGELIRDVAREWDKPLWLPRVPGFVLRAALGDMAQIVLEGSRASADKIKNVGFEFQYPELTAALSAIHDEERGSE